MQVYVAASLSLLLFASASVSSWAQSKQQSQRTSAKNAVLLAKLAQKLPTPPIRPLIGKYESHTVLKGENLLKIARSRNISVTAIQRLNGLKSSRVKTGKRILLPTLHVIPRNPGDGILLNVPERALYIFKGGKLEARYPVAIGRNTWQTALGEFKIRKKLKNPPWQPSKEMVEREEISEEIVPPGPKNPLGDRWMGWSVPGFGFHSTLAPQSIGGAASHGCVRLYPEAAHKLFDQISVGMPIHSVYEPVVMGKAHSKFYLSVFPDIYHTGMTTLAHIRKMLAAAGLLDVIDPNTLKQIVARADGFPHRIVGVDEVVKVNGIPVKGAVLPTKVDGQWIVPIREVVSALGGQVSGGPGERILVTGGKRKLSLRPGQREADLDGRSIKLVAAPTVIQGAAMAPLGPLLQAMGGSAAYKKGKTLQITSAYKPGRGVPASTTRASTGGR